MLASRLAAPPARAFRVLFTGSAPDEAGVLRLENPWLGGAVAEELFDAVTPAGVEQGVRLFHAGGLLLGCAETPRDGGPLALQTQSLYERILAVTQGWQLYRIWNYVPDINAFAGGLENYRAFCLGRGRAFASALGADFAGRLPAASAVGSPGGSLATVFVAGTAAPTHVENPEQVPAYRYPPEHGPQPPSFARATVARDGRDTWWFISGTAAIKGHQTIAPRALAPQLSCTLDNLRLIGRATGLSESLQPAGRGRRHFKIYLRHAADYPAARTELERSLLAPGDVATYLHADICRAALDIEIEATITSAPSL